MKLKNKLSLILKNKLFLWALHTAKFSLHFRVMVNDFDWLTNIAVKYINV